jgi:hypothetical protein
MQQFSIAQSHGTKLAGTFSCWMVQHNRIFALVRNPHSTSGTVLLEVALVQRPKINRIIGSIFSDFF